MPLRSLVCLPCDLILPTRHCGLGLVHYLVAPALDSCRRNIGEVERFPFAFRALEIDEVTNLKIRLQKIRSIASGGCECRRYLIRVRKPFFLNQVFKHHLILMLELSK